MFLDAEIAKAHALEECARSLRIAEDMQHRTKDEMEKSSALDRQLRDASKEIKVKDAMLEDQNDSIRKLKQALASAQEEHNISEVGLREAVQELLVRDLRVSQSGVPKVWTH